MLQYHSLDVLQELVQFQRGHMGISLGQEKSTGSVIVDKW